MTDLPPMAPRTSILTDRPITHEEARGCAQRFINSLFQNPNGATVSIPADRDNDDDLVLMAYIAQQQSRQPEIDALKKLVYVPGLWRCPKCEFSLLQSNLNAVDGTVTARDYPGDKCPNCNSPLWRVTERQAGNDVADRCEEQMRRAVEAEAKIDALRAALAEAERTLITIRDVFQRCGGREQYDAVFREWGITALARIREVKRDG